MRKLTIFYSNGQKEIHHTPGTTPQLQKAFYLGREIGAGKNKKTIEALTIENTIKIDHINHIDLRSDLENNNIDNTILTIEGKIGESPETWSIECTTPEGEYITNYLYDSKNEYNEDLKILNI